MEIKRLDHITIIVKDLEKTMSFYADVMGFTREQTVDCGDHILRYFRVPGGQRIELNQYLYEVADHKGKLNDKGSYRHCAFEVTDISGWEKRITQAGYPFHIPVHADEKNGVYSGLFLDPNGVEIELIEYKEASKN